MNRETQQTTVRESHRPCRHNTDLNTAPGQIHLAPSTRDNTSQCRQYHDCTVDSTHRTKRLAFWIARGKRRDEQREGIGTKHYNQQPRIYKQKAHRQSGIVLHVGHWEFPWTSLVRVNTNVQVPHLLQHRADGVVNAVNEVALSANPGRSVKTTDPGIHKVMKQCASGRLVRVSLVQCQFGHHLSQWRFWS